MTTNLGEIYDDLFIRSGKDFRGGFISPARFNVGLRIVNERKMNELIDVFEQNGEILADLIPFVKTLGTPQYPPLSFTPVLATDPRRGGYATVPSDFWYEARANYTKTVNVACTSTSEYAPITLLKQHEFDAVMADSNDNPTLDDNNYPVMVVQNDLFWIFPYMSRASFTYISQPVQPVYDYDIISGVPVYLPPGEVHVNSSVLPAGTPSQSVEFEYPESCVDSLTDMLKTYFGIANTNEWNIKTQLPPKNA